MIEFLRLGHIHENDGVTVTEGEKKKVKKKAIYSKKRGQEDGRNDPHHKHSDNELQSSPKL